MNSLTQGRACTPQCSAIGAINFSGNITPNTWYQRLRFPGGEKRKGRVHLPAVVILAEIVWWYRPMEKRDEQTGASLGFFRKFHGDKLQLSYQAMADKLGLTKRQASDACKYLEREGYIELEFRTIHRNGMALNNVLFIDVDPEAIKDLTHSDPVTFERGRVSRLNGGGVTFKRGTNTEINSEITTETSKENMEEASSASLPCPFENSGEAKQGGGTGQQHLPGKQKDQKPKTPGSGLKEQRSAAAPRKPWKLGQPLPTDQLGYAILPRKKRDVAHDWGCVATAKYHAVLWTQREIVDLCDNDGMGLSQDEDGEFWVETINGEDHESEAFAPDGDLPLRKLRDIAIHGIRGSFLSRDGFNEMLQENFEAALRQELAEYGVAA